MQSRTMVDHSSLTDDQLSELKDKFLQLLELDRDSDEFLRLFAEVDARLDACIESELQVNVA